MEEEHIKLLAFNAQSALYLDVLTSIRARASWSFDGRHQELIVPFVITCAAALECTLNDCFIHTFRGTKHLEAQLDGYLSMTLKGKLLNVVPAVTSQRFAINQEHKAYQCLVELIRTRNRLVHNRGSFFEEHFGIVRAAEDGTPMLTLPDGVDFEKYAEQDFTCGIEGDVGRFHDALHALYEKFMRAWDPDDFKGNDLVILADPIPQVYKLRIKDA